MSTLSVGLRDDNGLIATVGLNVDAIGGVLGSAGSLDGSSGVSPVETDMGALAREPGVSIDDAGAWSSAHSEVSALGLVVSPCRLFRPGVASLSVPLGATTSADRWGLLESALALASFAACGCGFCCFGLLSASGMAGTTRPCTDCLRLCSGMFDPFASLLGGMA